MSHVPTVLKSDRSVFDKMLPVDDNVLMLFYPGCHVRTTYTGCTGIHAHGRQVTSLLCLSDVIMFNCILTYSGTSGSLFKKKKKNSG